MLSYSEIRKRKKKKKRKCKEESKNNQRESWQKIEKGYYTASNVIILSLTSLYITSHSSTLHFSCGRASSSVIKNSFISSNYLKLKFVIWLSTEDYFSSHFSKQNLQETREKIIRGEWEIKKKWGKTNVCNFLLGHIVISQKLKVPKMQSWKLKIRRKRNAKLVGDIYLLYLFCRYKPKTLSSPEGFCFLSLVT